MTPQYKIKAAKRKHLYGSKSFFNVARKAIYSLKNYSDEQFTVFGIGNLEKNFGKKNGALCISYHYLF